MQTLLQHFLASSMCPKALGKRLSVELNNDLISRPVPMTKQRPEGVSQG